MRISESLLRNIIRSVLLEGIENNLGLGNSLSLNYGDIVMLKMNRAANGWISTANPDFDMMAYAELDYKVHSVYIRKGDESKKPIVFCELLDVDSGEIIKDVPCYSDVLSVVKRMKQCRDLREGDRFILKEITEYDYFSYRGKVDLQELVGSVFKIIRINNSVDFHGKLYTNTRYAIISPEDLEDYKVLFVIPLVDEFVEKLN